MYDPFNPNDRRWYCACNTHCRTGVFAIGIYQIIIGVLDILLSIYSFVGNFIGYGIGQIIIGALFVALGVMLIIAVKKEEIALLFPSLIVLWLNIVLLLASLTLSLIFGITAIIASNTTTEPIVWVYLGFYTVAVLIAVALDLWFISIIQKYRRFLSEKLVQQPMRVNVMPPPSQGFAPYPQPQAYAQPQVYAQPQAYAQPQSNSMGSMPPTYNKN